MKSFFSKNPSIFTMYLDQIVSTQQDIIEINFTWTLKNWSIIFLPVCVNENIRKSLCKTYIDILKTESLSMIFFILYLNNMTFLYERNIESVFMKKKNMLEIINWGVVKHSYLVLFLKFSNSWSKSVQRVSTLGIQWRKHVVLVGVWGNKEGRQPGGGRGKS